MCSSLFLSGALSNFLLLKMNSKCTLAKQCLTKRKCRLFCFYFFFCFRQNSAIGSRSLPSHRLPSPVPNFDVPVLSTAAKIIISNCFQSSLQCAFSSLSVRFQIALYRMASPACRTSAKIAVLLKLRCISLCKEQSEGSEWAVSINSFKKQSRWTVSMNSYDEQFRRFKQWTN